VVAGWISTGKFRFLAKKRGILKKTFGASLFLAPSKGAIPQSDAQDAHGSPVFVKVLMVEQLEHLYHKRASG
jgi:hypothetical protein